MVKKWKKHFRYFRKISIYSERFPCDPVKYSGPVWWHFHAVTSWMELSRTSGNRVVVLLFVCLFLPQQYNTSLLCNTLSIWIYSLAFCWMVHILESQQFSGFPEKFLWDVFLTSKVPQLWVVYRVGRIEGNYCATLTFNFFQEFCATVNYLIRISANFLFNGLKTNSFRNLWKLFRENFLPNSFPFQLNFCSRTVIDSFPAHKSRPYLIGCLDECLQKPARVEDQSLHRFSFYLRLAVWRILSLKLLPLFSFYLVVIQLVSMYKSCVT